MLDAAVRRVPITGGVERVSAPEGSSIAEFVALAFPAETHRRFVVAVIDGEEIPVEAWERVPRGGERLELVFRPGGKDFFRTVLQIAVIAVAVWVSGGGLGGIFAAGSWQAAVAAAGVSILGNLAINSLIPLPKPGTVEAPPPYYSLSSARNASRLWGVVPMLFGTHRIAAPRMSEPFQEVIGGITYLRVALCLGLCPMQATDWKIGETALSEFSGVEMEVRLNEGDPAHTLITGDPTQEAVGAVLNHTDWTVRTTATNVDEIEVIYDFPNGLGGVDSKNRKTARTVELRLQYRPTGSSEDWSDWRPDVPQANEASAGAGAPYRPEYFTLNEDLEGWRAELDGLGGVASGTVPVTRSEAGRHVRHSERFAVPRGQYDVRTQRVAAASTDPNVVDAVQWGVLGSIRSQADPFPNRQLATACFRIKATDQLSNMVDTLNCIGSSVQPVFSPEALADPSIADAGEFASEETSSNPAVLALLAMRGPNTAYPKPDEEVDWPSFAEAAAKATARGLTFNEYVETTIGRWEMVRRILAAMHARPVKHNGRVSIVVDDDKTGQAPAQVFTPRNVSNFRWRKTYPRLPHAIKTPFANAANGWAADEVTVFLPGQTEETATRYETVAMPGKTDADEIRTVVNQYARNSFFQTEGFDFDVDAEHIACKRGDYAVVQHFAMATGLGAARIRTREMSGGNVTSIVLDAPVDTPDGETLAAQWRTIVVEGDAARMEVLGEETVTRDPANPKRFVLVTPIAAADAPVAWGEDYEGDVALIGIAGKVSYEVLVRDILPRPHLKAAISCVAYAGERFVDAPTWPAHNPKVTLPYAPRPSAPVLQAAIARQLEIAVAFSQPVMPRGVTLAGYTVARREHGSAGDSWEPLGSLRAEERVAILPPGDPGAKYDARIVAFGHRDDGVLVYSNELVASEIEAATAPAAPAGCSASFATRTSAGGASQLVLTAVWTANEDTGVLDTRVEMRASTGPDVWVEIGQARAALGRTEIHGLQVGRSYTLGFTNLSRRGAPSARTTISAIIAPDTLIATGAVAAVPGSALDLAIGSMATAAASAASAAASAAAAATSQSAAAGSASAASGYATAASSSQTAAAGSASAAATSASAAAASASAASGSASAASTSATAAASSATAAGTSASAASTSATNAATSAGNASTSATAASGSATTAAGHASTASTAATAAAASQSAAAGAASAASTSASTASTQASNASTSASAAATSATNASTSASAASTSASAASTSAGNAASSATTASTQASNAAGSASAASSSASAASTFATAAATSASLSASFSGRNAGSLVKNPSFNNYASGATAPADWTADDTDGSRVTGFIGAYAHRMPSGAGEDATYLLQFPTATMGPHQIEVSAVLGSGAYTGAGILVVACNAVGTTLSNQGFNLATLADINGDISASKAGLRHYRLAVTLPANTAYVELFAFGHYSGFGSVAAANSIDWHAVDFRPASSADVGLVTANANIATNASAIATETTARVALSTLVTARVGQLPSSEVTNPAFSAWANPATWPDGWGVWNAGSMDGRTTGRIGPYGMYVSAGAGQNGGFTRSQGSCTPGKKIVEICMERSVGSWVGAGIYIVTYTDATYTTSVDAFAINLATTADIEGVTGSTGATRRWRVPVTFSSTVGAFLIIGMNHWTTFGSVAALNQFIWHQLDLHPVDYGEAQAQINAGAISDLNSSAAWIEAVVAAGGGDLGAFRLRAGKAGSFIELISTVLRLANVSNGSVIEIMRAIGGEAFFSRPISSDGGGKRVTIGPGYGVGGSEVVLWFGADTVAPSSQSRTNGYFALGTDGKVYYGAAEITAPTINDATKTGVAAFDNVTTSGTTVHTMATIDLTVGASGYLELMSPLFYGPLSLNQETGMTLSAGSSWFGQMIVTEQLQSGGTEHTLWTIPLEITDTGGGLFDFVFDPPVVKAVAQNVSGASRYRIKLQRTSGSNNVSGNGLQGKFSIRRTP